jgi:hypothetical protein
MTVKINGLSLTEAEHAIEEAHPGWHVWHSRDGKAVGRICATCTTGTLGGSGTTLDAPSAETIERVIAQWEWEHPAEGRLSA